MSTRTEAGVPVPAAGELYPQRHAMDNPTARDLVAKYIEEVGGLGAVASDKKFKPGQDYFRAFMEQEMNSVVGREVPQSGGMA